MKAITVVFVLTVLAIGAYVTKPSKESAMIEDSVATGQAGIQKEEVVDHGHHPDIPL